MHRHDRNPRFLTWSLALLLWPMLLRAGITIQVDGVTDPLKVAVLAAVQRPWPASAGQAQARNLIARAPVAIRRALQPYGYYQARVSTLMQHTGKDWYVTLHVYPGVPVKVTAVTLNLDQKVPNIHAIKKALRRIRKLKGKRLRDTIYEARRDDLSNALNANGYLDAQLTQHRVEVNRTLHSAHIRLAWHLGKRYRFGQVHFHGSPFNTAFLKRYVSFRCNDYFSHTLLLKFQQALNNSGYFSMVDVHPLIASPQAGRVNIEVHLSMVKRNLYSGGPIFGTDIGMGLRAHIKRRWVNRDGHTWNAEMILAQRLKNLSTRYSIPLSGAFDRNLDIGADYENANTATSQSNTLKLMAQQTKQWQTWSRKLGVQMLTGTFTVGKRRDEPNTTVGIEHGRSTLLLFNADISYQSADYPSFVRSGTALDLYVRSTAGTALSSVRFSQVGITLKTIRAFTHQDRLILHAALGKLYTNHFDALPPTLRFFAGGSASVRGYAFQEIGPKNRYGRVIGGHNLLLVGITLEHYFTRHFGLAVFADAGNAFNTNHYRPKIGIGVGLRWRTALGLIRLDLGMPVHDPKYHTLKPHLVIGPDL